MKILARWSVMLTMAFTVGFTAVETKVEAASDLANNSQENLKNNQQDKKVASTPTKIIEPTVLIAAGVSQTSENKTEAVKNTDILNNSIEDKLVKKTAMVSKRSAVRSFRATAYCLKGRTANGGSVRRGIVAADRRVLPLGTKVYIDAGAYSGTYTVTDTGGAVKGNILDIWVPSCAEANRFGRKSIGVSIIGN